MPAIEGDVRMSLRRPCRCRWADGLAMMVARRTAPTWASKTRPMPFTQTGLNSPLPASKGSEKTAPSSPKTRCPPTS